MLLLYVLIFLCLADCISIVISRYYGRTITGHTLKILLNPLIYSILFVYLIKHGVSYHEFEILFIPMVCYTIGDICMNPDGFSMFFVIGQAFFVIGHVFYSIFWLRNGIHESFFSYGVLLALLFFVAFGIGVMKKAKDKKVILFILPYAIVLSLFLATALGAYNGLLPTSLRSAGVISCIFASTAIGANVTNRYDTPDFVVSIFYILACLLLAISAGISIMQGV